MTTEENDQVLQRKEKLEVLRGEGNAYPNDFRRDTDTREIRRNYDHVGDQALTATPTRVTIAGRVMTRRVMGKAGFADMHDEHGKIQIYAQRDRLADGVYNRLFRLPSALPQQPPRCLKDQAQNHLRLQRQCSYLSMTARL